MFADILGIPFEADLLTIPLLDYTNYLGKVL